MHHICFIPSSDSCTPEDAKASNCYIIDGAVTLLVEGVSKEYDEELKMSAYSRLEELFDNLPETLEDPNIVDVEYMGTSPPSIIASDAPAGDEPEDDSTTIAKATVQDEEALNAVWLAIGGGMVAVAMLITGFHRMNQQKEAIEDSISPDEKSNDGQSTAYNTAELTIAATGSDLSSIASPARSLDAGLPPTPSPAKFFILSEEEEQNWRDLSILPALAQDDGTLEGVSEEDEFIGTVRSKSESSGEISV